MKIQFDDSFLKKAYSQILPLVRKHVINNSGSAEEADDLFQEAILIAYRRVLEEDFKLTSSIETFIYAIAKRKWLHELRKRKKTTPIGLMDIEPENGNDIEVSIELNERRKIFLKYFNDLKGNCRQVLKLFFEGNSMQDISDIMNFSSEGYARKRKHNCQQSLIEMIKKDSHFKELSYERA
jgi:RNA polymerase sigma factor (sigma-70 family)